MALTNTERSRASRNRALIEQFYAELDARMIAERAPACHWCAGRTLERCPVCAPQAQA